MSFLLNRLQRERKQLGDDIEAFYQEMSEQRVTSNNDRYLTFMSDQLSAMMEHEKALAMRIYVLTNFGNDH